MLSKLQGIARRKRDKPIPNRRTLKRETCSIAAWLFDGDGMVTSATILDRSEGGVRVTCSEKGFPARAAYLLRADTGAAYRLRCVWHAPEIAGYEFLGRVDGRPNGKDHAIDALRVAWLEHAAERGAS